MATKTTKTTKAAPPEETPAAPKQTAAAAKEPAAAAKKPASGLAKPVKPSKELAVIVGKKAIPRTEVISKVWAHIRKHDLQNPANRREIVADEALKAVFGKDRATMFEMNKLLSAHLS